MFQLVTHGTGPVLTPGASYEQTWLRSTRRCYIPNIKALHLLQWKPVMTQSSGSIDQTRDISGLTDKPCMFSPPSIPCRPRMACIRSRSSHIMNIFTIYNLPYSANMLVQMKIISIFCVPILTSIKSYLVFSSTETYYQIRHTVILFVKNTAEYYVID